MVGVGAGVAILGFVARPEWQERGNEFLFEKRND